MKKSLSALFFAAFSVLSVSAVEFGDIEAQYPLYSEADPFAIAKATNAYAIATNAANAAAYAYSPSNPPPAVGEYTPIGDFQAATNTFSASITNEAAMRIAVSAAGTNYTDQISALKIDRAGDTIKDHLYIQDEGDEIDGEDKSTYLKFTSRAGKKRSQIGHSIDFQFEGGIFPLSIESQTIYPIYIGSKLSVTGDVVRFYRGTEVVASIGPSGILESQKGFAGSGIGLTNISPAQVGAVAANGGNASNLTLGGSVDATSATYVRVPAPVSGSDAATVSWVRGLLNSGSYYYNTTQYIETAFATNTYLYSTNNPAALVPKTFAVVSNGQYVSSIVTPEHVILPHGPAVVSVWLEKTGLPSSSVSIKPELYFTDDLTNVIYEAAGVVPQPVTTGNNLYQWVIHFPDQPSSYVVRRLKVTAVSGSPSITVSGGDGYPSTLTITSLGAGSDDLGARGATNLTVNGVAQTYDSGTRTLSATVSADSAGVYCPIAPTATGVASVVVSVVPSRCVYTVDVAAPTAFSNDLSALTLDGTSNAVWSVFYNVLSTNAVTTWAPNISWAYAPVFTVTGRYEFAFSTVDGLTVQARQEYPNACCEWQPLTFGGAGQAYQANQLRYMTLLSASASNHFVMLSNPFPNRYSIVSVGYINAGVSAPNQTAFLGQDVIITTPVYSQTKEIPVATGNGGTVLMAIPATNLAQAVSYYFKMTTSVFPNANVNIHSPLARPMNELEIKAYNAGWRP